MVHIQIKLLLSHHHNTCALMSEKAVPQSASAGSDATETSPRGSREQSVGRVAGVFYNPPGFPCTPPGVDILEGGKLTSNNAGVEGSEDSGDCSKLPQPSQEEETLMCLLQHCICVSRPCEILGDVNAEELKAGHPLHRCLVDGDGCVFSALSPVIHHQLLGLVDVE